MQLHRIYFNSLSYIKLFFLLVIISLFLSCYNVNEAEVITPKKMLTKMQMVDILTDMQITEAGFSINKNINQGKELKPEYYNIVFEQHSVTLQQFKENIDYYYASPKVMEDIYELVLGNLSKMQSEAIIEKEKFEKQFAADSIAFISDSLELIVSDSILILEEKAQ